LIKIRNICSSQMFSKKVVQTYMVVWWRCHRWHLVDWMSNVIHRLPMSVVVHADIVIIWHHQTRRTVYNKHNTNTYSLCSQHISGDKSSKLTPCRIVFPSIMWHYSPQEHLNSILYACDIYVCIKSGLSTLIYATNRHFYHMSENNKNK